MGDKNAVAKALHENSFNCSQSVLGAFCEDYDLDTETALRIAGPFGGGMRIGETCGAVTGALMVIGLRDGHYIAGDLGAKANCESATAEFMQAFREKHGTCRCIELIGLDLTVPENREKARETGLFGTICAGLIDECADMLVERGYGAIDN
jgi:C_GCAxxG_C_C family probable redox protein